MRAWAQKETSKIAAIATTGGISIQGETQAIATRNRSTKADPPGRETGRRNEITDRLKRAQIGRKRTDGCGPALHAQVQNALHDLRGQLHIHTLARGIDNIGTRRRQHEVEDQHQRNADSQHPQCFHRVVGHHPVIHIHAEQGHGQRKDIDEHGGQQGIAVQAPVLQNHGPEPVAAARLHALLHGALLEAGHFEHQPTVLQQGGLHLDRTIRLRILQQATAPAP
jgi:hypothetical protein